MVGMDHGNRLGEFLRARRERVRPPTSDCAEDDAAAAGRRGCAGRSSRMLAGVSTNYVVRLEQGVTGTRRPRCSTRSRAALQLDDAATAHLHRLGTPATDAALAPDAGPQADAVVAERRAAARTGSPTCPSRSWAGSATCSPRRRWPSR